jgi:hypothetical protein
MKENELEEIFKKYDIFDGAILEHGFTKNNRDYRIVIDTINNKLYEFYFIGCVELKYTNILSTQELSFEDYQDESYTGYVWVDFSVLYPGVEIIKESKLISKWIEKYHKEFNHIKITTNVFELEIVFNKLNVI